MMDSNPQIVDIGEWVVRVREPEGPGPHPVILLLHGWTGDENVMWVFAPRLPKNALLLAPRALHSAPQGGYSWHPFKKESWPHVDQFRPPAESLLELIELDSFPNADFSQLSLVGFSQGAALSYTFALLYPERVQAVAGLSGFLPEGAEGIVAQRPLDGMPVFVTHGSQDEIVPVARARTAVELLEQAGGQVTYCEDDVGHKLSATCFRGLETFFARPPGGETAK